ncbi:MAG: hypothetical protein ABI854_02700 [Betaproteobacteria bacterium]
MHSIPDPRVFAAAPGLLTAAQQEWLTWTEQSLSAATGQERELADAKLRAALAEVVVAADVTALQDALNAAAHPAQYRHLWRALVAAWHATAAQNGSHLVAHGFALPVVLVTAADEAIELPGVLDDVATVASLLQQHGALAGNRNFGLANVLAGAEALGLDSLPRWLGRRDAQREDGGPDSAAPLPIAVAAGQEGAHLRFILGSALAAASAVLFVQRTADGWGIPVAQHLSRQLGVAGVQVLALPRAPMDPWSALHDGRIAHREVGWQLFASSAIRALRAAFGEPTAVISAHRTSAGGELRVSLSSPFGERDAQGFRCPLYPFDRVEDVTAMLVDLLRACRISDIRMLAAVQPDRDPLTGLLLLFRADAIGASESIQIH